MSRRGGRRLCRHEAGLDIFWKKDLESLSRLVLISINLSLQINANDDKDEP